MRNLHGYSNDFHSNQLQFNNKQKCNWFPIKF